MTATGPDSWSFAGARGPSQFAAAANPKAPETEHAIGEDETLCGIPREAVLVYRHLFAPAGPRACPVCRREWHLAPTRPSTQERLHDLVMAAPAGSLRDELIEALRSGADIETWINGPAESLGKHYVKPDRIVEGREALVAALRTGERVGLARIDRGDRQFVVVLPAAGPPVIARVTA